MTNGLKVFDFEYGSSRLFASEFKCGRFRMILILSVLLRYGFEMFLWNPKLSDRCVLNGLLHIY